MKRFLTWLVYSSVNPEELGLTTKGALMGILPVLLFFGQQLHLHWTQTSLVETIQAISSMVSAFFMIVGLTRKLIIGAIQVITTIAGWFKNS